MAKLLQRLSDATKSGVYCARRAEDILDAVRGSSIRIARIGLAGASDKAGLMGRIAPALDFPQWFGGNWDALEDCLTDLSWLKADGHVLLFEDAEGMAADECGVLVDILASSAAYWAERKRPFFAVFVGGAPRLPELYREKR